MRKAFVAFVLAAFSSLLCASCALGGGGMSLMMRRNLMAAKSGGWVNPYVTDGLVAMWDGEWNAGPGVHDPNATVWKDLSGNGNDIELNLSCIITDDAVVYTSEGKFEDGFFGGVCYKLNGLPYPLKQVTNECVCKLARSASWSENPRAFWYALGSIRQVWMQFYHLNGYTNGLLRGASASYISYYNSGKDHPRVAVSNGDFTTYASEGGFVFYPQSETAYGAASDHEYQFGDSLHILTAQVSGQTNELSCLRIYNRTLSQDERTSNIAIDKARFNIQETT